MVQVMNIADSIYPAGEYKSIGKHVSPNIETFSNEPEKFERWTSAAAPDALLRIFICFVILAFLPTHKRFWHFLTF